MKIQRLTHHQFKSRLKRGHKPAEVEEVATYKLDIGIGMVVEVSRHPDVEKLYVEKIVLGELSPRIIVRGRVQGNGPQL